MEKSRFTKVIAIVALFIAITGVTIGFAAWNATLTITTPSTTVKQGTSDSSFKDLLTIKSINCDTKTGSANATNVGAISEDNFSWTGVNIELSKPNDSITCTATVENNSDYNAYFDSISIASQITCTGQGQNVQNVCSILKLEAIGTGSSTNTASVKGTTITNETTIANNYIAKKTEGTAGTGTISFKLTYDGTEISDTDFTASIPTMTFNFSSVD